MENLHVTPSNTNKVVYEEVLLRDEDYFKTALHKEEETTLMSKPDRTKLIGKRIQLTVSRCVNLLRKFLYINLKPLLYLSTLKLLVY